MALRCKICNAELDVFAAGRCKQCRQLVCDRCVQSHEPGGGLLCVECAAHAPVDPPSPPPPSGVHAPAAGTETRNLLLQTWAVVAYAMILTALFLLIFIFPWWQSNRLLQRIQFGTQDEAEYAIQHMRDLRGRIPLTRLRAIVETEVEPARTRAIRALGVLPEPDSLQYLRDLQAQTTPDDPLQMVISESIFDHLQRYGEGDGRD